MPSKKKVKSAPSNFPPAPIANALEISNGLSDAIMGNQVQGLGAQLAQLGTLFHGMRGYLVSTMRQPLSEMYVEYGLIQNLIDVPVDDAMRGGVEIKTKLLEEDQISDLVIEMERESIYHGVVGQAAKWNRLFGGAAILIMTGQDPKTPLDITAIGPDDPLEFRAVDMWEILYNVQSSAGKGTPIEAIPDFYNYYGQQIHNSRVLRLKGLEAPSFVRPRLRGWGFSIIESLVRSINQYLKSNDLTFEVIDEFKLDIFKIKNLSQSLLQADGTTRVRERIALANYQKNYHNALTMDAEDDFMQKQLTWSGLAEMMKEFRIQIASDMRMPMTKLFGLSSSGFNSGEEDLENYNAMVESTVRSKVKFEILRILELKCQKKFGFVPDDLKIEFEPLRILSAEQQENVKTQQFNRVAMAVEKGLCSLKEAKEAINKDDLLPLKVDTSLETLPLGADQNDDPEKKKKSGDEK